MSIRKSNLRGFHVRSENIRHRMIATQEDDLAPGLNSDRAVGFRTRVDTSCATPLWSCNGVVCGGNAKVNVTAKHTLDCPLRVEALLGDSRLRQQVLVASGKSEGRFP
jgi:hypothetical protein